MTDQKEQPVYCACFVIIEERRYLAGNPGFIVVLALSIRHEPFGYCGAPWSWSGGMLRVTHAQSHGVKIQSQIYLILPSDALPGFRHITRPCHVVENDNGFLRQKGSN